MHALCFNPTRVLLKQLRCRYSLVVPGCFNPTRVLLKPFSSTPGPFAPSRFNPTRVLLKQRIRDNGVDEPRPLQSHKGSSETRGVERSLLLRVASIPQGFF